MYVCIMNKTYYVACSFLLRLKNILSVKYKKFNPQIFWYWYKYTWLFFFKKNISHLLALSNCVLRWQINKLQTIEILHVAFNPLKAEVTIDVFISLVPKGLLLNMSAVLFFKVLHILNRKDLFLRAIYHQFILYLVQVRVERYRKTQSD